MKKTPIDEYIAGFPPERQKLLRAVRRTIQKAAPGAEEKISWNMPTFYQGENLVHFAAAKKHLGFYPGPEALAAFSKETVPYKNSKGAVQFPYDRPMPHELIAAVTAFRVKAVSAKVSAKGAGKTKTPAGGRRCLALLRGINVGGQGIIKMAELRDAFAALGFSDVSTYIQSGNVLFSAAGPLPAVVKKLETGLSKRFNLDLKVVAAEAEALAGIIKKRPSGFGDDPARKYDVIFLRPPLTAEAAFPDIGIREGVDEAAPGEGVIYVSRLTARASQSYISKIVQSPHYKEMTIRNWNTVSALAALMSGEAR